MNAPTPANDTPALGLRESFQMSLKLELERIGWTEANQHFEDACQAARHHDGEGYERAMAEFRRCIARSQEILNGERLEGGNVLQSN